MRATRRLARARLEMSYLNRLVPTLVGVVVLAGCFSHPHAGSPLPSSSSSAPRTSSSTMTSSPLPPPTNGTFLQKLALSQCTGFYAVTEGMPKAVAPGQAPSGWESTDPVNSVSVVFMDGYLCHRIHVGPYERGPIAMVWDAHDNADIPDACLQGTTGPTHSQIFNVLLINDSQIATYLQQQYGLPAQYADIDVSAQSAAAPLVLRPWSWALPGQAASNFTLIDDSTNQTY